MIAALTDVALGTAALLTVAALLAIYVVVRSTVRNRRVVVHADHWHVRAERIFDWERVCPEWRPLRLVVDPEQWDEYLQVPRSAS